MYEPKLKPAITLHYSKMRSSKTTKCERKLTWRNSVNSHGGMPRSMSEDSGLLVRCCQCSPSGWWFPLQEIQLGFSMADQYQIGRQGATQAKYCSKTVVIAHGVLRNSLGLNQIRKWLFQQHDGCRTVMNSPIHLRKWQWKSASCDDCMSSYGLKCIDMTSFRFWCDVFSITIVSIILVYLTFQF